MSDEKFNILILILLGVVIVILAANFYQQRQHAQDHRNSAKMIETLIPLMNRVEEKIDKQNEIDKYLDRQGVSAQ